jgi:hypothetical protein
MHGCLKPASDFDFNKRAFEIERAWRKHEPLRARVPNSATVKARAMITAVAHDGERILNVCQEPLLHAIVTDWRYKKKVGKQRAFMKLVSLLVPSCIREDRESLVVISLLAYGPNVAATHTRYAQDAISVLALRLGKSFRPALALEVPVHALARMFERGAMTPVEAQATIHEAAGRFLAADHAAMERAASTAESVALPAGSGLLLGEVIALHDADFDAIIGNPLRLFHRARTWIPLSDAMANQEPPPASDAPASVLYRQLDFYAMKSDVGLA